MTSAFTRWNNYVVAGEKQLTKWTNCCIQHYNLTYRQNGEFFNGKRNNGYTISIDLTHMNQI